MTTNQSKKLKMLLALRVLLRANPLILAKLPNVEEFLTALDSCILQIQTNSVQQEEGTGNVTQEKSKLRLTLTTDTVDASRKLQAYAAYSKDDALLQTTKYTESDLKNQLDVELVKISKLIYNKANDNLAKLTAYGITQDTQDSYLADIEAYEKAIPESKKLRQDQKDITTLIAQNFEEADEVVASIDLLVEIVRLSESKFYADYKAMRKTEESSSSIQVQAKVTDAATNAPITNATATFTLSGDTKPVVVKQTAEKGGFFIKNLDEGIYTVAVSKLGYQSQTLTVTVTSDAVCDINVKLVKG